MPATEIAPRPQAAPPPSSDEMPARNYLNDAHTVRSWLLTIDHKRIGILYLFTILFFFFIAAAAAALMRWELLTPGGDVVLPTTYNKLFTIHGVLMIWFSWCRASRRSCGTSYCR